MFQSESRGTPICNSSIASATLSSLRNRPEGKCFMPKNNIKRSMSGRSRNSVPDKLELIVR